jgi:hypothetical protein
MKRLAGPPAVRYRLQMAFATIGTANLPIPTNSDSIFFSI